MPPLSELPAQAELLDALAGVVTGSDRWRWLELSCSLASDRGDELSDIDAGIGYDGTLNPEELEQEGSGLVRATGEVVDLLVHQLPGWPPEARRFAVEYATGVQLDLVLMPAGLRKGLPAESVAIVDKDGILASPWTPPVAGPPDRDQAREWLMLGWWALSNVAKYLRRESLYEAVDHIAEAREQALRLFAAAHGVPFPLFGLVSLLDYPPFDLPESLERTYCVPDDRAAVGRAALATAELLARSGEDAARALGLDLATPWAGIARQRLAGAVT